MAKLEAQGQERARVRRSEKTDDGETRTYTQALFSNDKILQKWQVTCKPSAFDRTPGLHKWPWKHHAKLKAGVSTTAWVEAKRTQGWELLSQSEA